MVRDRLHFDMGMRGGATQGSATHHGQVWPVIAHGCGLRPIGTQSLQRDFCSGAFIFGAKVSMLDPQALQARAQRTTVTSGDDDGRDARLLLQLQPVTVKGVETLERLALIRHVQTAICEDAIDIKKCDLDALCPEQQFRRKTQDRIQRAQRNFSINNFGLPC